jgi:hypothetical protein
VGVFAGQLAVPFAVRAQPVAQAAAPTVEVELASGRTFRAAVDPRTDDEQLWLRFGDGDLTILRPVAWASIKAVRHAGQTHTAADFRALAEELKQQTPRAVFRPRSRLERLAIPAGQEFAPLPPPIVRQIHIDAYVANWDHDVEVDGVVIHLFASGDDGSLIPAAGTLEATLIGRRANPAGYGEPFPQLGRWTVPVEPQDFGPAGAVYRLPFQAVHPDFDFRVGAQAVLNARLIAAGSGTFDASAAMLRIRPYSGMRDRLQQQTGQRFFSIERTGRTQ